MRPNLLAHYLYLWELTAVRQAVETGWISVSVRRTFIELLVPAGSSSSLGQGSQLGPQLSAERGGCSKAAGDCEGADPEALRVRPCARYPGALPDEPRRSRSPVAQYRAAEGFE